MAKLSLPWTEWDARIAVRAAAIATAALLVSWFVTAATDEGGITWGIRAGRALPLAPACAAIGTWLALAPGRARGEARTLEALGRSPLQRAAAAVFGGAAIALAASIAIVAIHRVDVEGFYPRLARDVTYRFEAGAFVSDEGFRIDRDGAPSRIAPAAPHAPPAPLPAHAREAAALATALAGLALPLLVAQLRRRTFGATMLAIALVAAATITGFQAAATGKVAVLAASLPPFVLLAVAFASYLPWQWPTVKSRK